ANLEEFRKNPVMLLNHDDYSLPIGRWENIRVEGGKILADAVFDSGDNRAAEIKRKVEANFIRMASIGSWPPDEKSDSYDLMIPGQRLPTVTKWTVREASIVTIGANHNALVFYDRESKQIIDLKDQSNLIRLMDHSNKQQKQTTMSVLTGVLKLQDSASEAEIVTAIQGIIANADRLDKENKTLVAAMDKMNAAKKESQKQEAIQLTDAAIKEGRYDAKGKETLIQLFDKDFEGTKTMLAAIPCRTNIASQIGSNNLGGVSLKDWKDKSWDDLDKSGKLVELRDADPEMYKSKFKERFGVEPNL
ncbi:MAG: hypothetical protein ACRCZQ_08435, partial [Bacteroidales bacterium]